MPRYRRYDGLTRAYRAIRTMETRRLTAMELAVALDLSRRTVYRHLRSMQDAGLPLAQDGSRYWLVTR